MKRVAIIGLGLMGGSLGMAIKRRGLSEVTAFARRGETRVKALEMGAADSVHDTPADAVKGADVIVFCTPVCSIPDLARECRDAFEAGAVVTDVGSTKADLACTMDKLFRDTRVSFVGSHPMAGSERTGMESARGDLYEGATAAVTPYPGTPMSAIAKVSDLWRGVGAHVVELSPERHDDLVARTSHLPHLIAALLVATSGREPNTGLDEFCGPGFRDTTRIAGGSPEMWHDIVKTNREAVLTELRQYGCELAELISRIEHQDYDAVRQTLEHARDVRKQLVG